MKKYWALAGTLLSIGLAVWWWARSGGPNVSIEDSALHALDRHAMAESALHTDLLSARNGMLRNYDSFTRETRQLIEAIDTLEATPLDAAIASRIANLRLIASKQEVAIEEFKTQNALLQNSLVYFGIFSARLNNAKPPSAAARQASALATAMLHLTLDTSPSVGAEVDAHLQALGMQGASDEETRTLEALLEQARLLRSLLPQTNAVLQDIFALPGGALRENIRALVLERRRAAELESQQFRYVLYATLLLLASALAWVGYRLYGRSLSLRRRAAIDHVLAEVSTRFINSSAGKISELVERSLEELAACFQANRAYFVVASNPPQIYRAGGGAYYPADWPIAAADLARNFQGAANGVICVNVRRVRGRHERAVLEAHGVRSWTCVSSRARKPVSILGFDFLKGTSRTFECEDGLLRMVFDAIANAVDRDVLERERAQLEASLRHARRMETIGVLTSGIAHNFNNIVGAILGFAETAQGHAAPAEELNEIRRAGERARDLVGQILAFGRRASSERRPVRVAQLVSEAQSLLRASLPSQVALVVTELGADGTVAAEPTQLQQVILNLCNNAAQAMELRGTIHIQVNERALGAPTRVHGEELAAGRYCVLSVSDTGHGMPPSVQARIFEPFFTTRPDGNGLGLATAHKIVLDHGGAIEVQSAPGQGTRFCVWLPSMEQTTSATVAAGEPPRSAHGQGETILLLEPDREQRLRLEEILAALGYEPVGYSCIADVPSGRLGPTTLFDAVLISTREPGADVTIGLATAARRAAPDIPIIVATSGARHINAEHLAAAGVSAIIGQPPTLSELAAALAGSLNVSVTAVAIHPERET